MPGRDYTRGLNRRAIEGMPDINPDLTVVKAAYVVFDTDGTLYVILDSDLDKPLTPLAKREAFLPKRGTGNA